jgi:two-component system, NarL family, sensor histidine kinase UhpB
MKGLMDQREGSAALDGDLHVQPGEIPSPPRWCEECFPLAFHSSPVAIGISSLADGRFIDVNKTFLEIYGYEREEVIGRSSEELGLWADPEMRREVLATLRDHGRVRNVEIRCRRKSGEIGSLLASGERIELAGEQCFLGTFFDITERKRIEEAFRENERRYRTVLEDQTEVICRFNSDGELTFVNAVYCRFFGKTKEELIGNKWHPNAVREDVPMIEERLASLCPENPLVVIENRVYSGTGEVRWMQFVNRAFFDEDGKLLESQSVGRDITDRKKVEQELRDSEERYRKLFDVETDAILLADMETMSFIDANLAARFMYGYTLEEFLRMKVEDISAEPEKSRHAIDSKRMMISHRLHRRKDGTVFPVEISGNYFEYRGRKVHVAAVRDITERIRTEKELNDRQNTINNMVMELSVVEEKERYRIAEHLHDQIAPKFLLTKMRIQSLAERLPSGEHDTTIEAIEALIDLAIEDIRSLTIQLRPPILAELGLEAALKWLAEEFNENYRLKVNISGDKEPKPLSYELGSAIFQIVRELLLNISKHAGTKSASISMVKEDDSIKITVEDKGIGFDVANSSLNKPRTGGFGIFNARMKIEYLGGGLEIESSPGCGTRVLIKAPLETHRK